MILPTHTNGLMNVSNKNSTSTSSNSSRTPPPTTTTNSSTVSSSSTATTCRPRMIMEVVDESKLLSKSFSTSSSSSSSSKKKNSITKNKTISSSFSTSRKNRLTSLVGEAKTISIATAPSTRTTSTTKNTTKKNKKTRRSFSSSSKTISMAQEQEQEQPKEVVTTTTTTATATESSTTATESATTSRTADATIVDTATATTATATTTHLQLPQLWSVIETDQLFYYSGLLMIPIYILLLGSVYFFSSSTSTSTTTFTIEYLNDTEQTVSGIACCIFAISLLYTCLPILRSTTKQSQSQKQKSQVSGILLCAIIIQGIAMITNLILAICPVPVYFDSITNARVYYVRWCEWIPLAGLMTFLSEGIDISIIESTERNETEKQEQVEEKNKTNNKNKKIAYNNTNIIIPIFIGIGQSISCFFGGIIPPLCGNNIYYWCITIFCSFMFFLTIFPRLYYKYQQYSNYYPIYEPLLIDMLQQQQEQQQQSNQQEGTTTTTKMKNTKNHSHHHRRQYYDSTAKTTQLELESYQRIKSGYYLLLLCCICWSVLVCNYFFVMWGMRNYSITSTTTDSTDSWLILWWKGQNDDSLAMISDTLFDVIAKCVYMKIIQEIHESTFNVHGRNRRQLQELRNMMTMLWENSTDVIMISTRLQQRTSYTQTLGRKDRIITIISPTFTNMVLGSNSSNAGGARDDSGSSSAYEYVPNEPFSTYLMTSCLPALIVTGELDPIKGLVLDSKVHAVDGQSIPYPMMDDPALFSSSPSSSSEGATTTDSTSTSTIATTGKTTKIIAASPLFPLPVGFEDQFEPQQRERLYQEAKRLTYALYHRNTQPRYDDEEEEEEENSEYDPNLLSHDVTSCIKSSSNNNNNNTKNKTDNTVRCELKLTQMDERVKIAVVRDVTERYRRFDAERRTLMEALARQNDAQSVNRFTRHEVKNGLLAGIEMCSYLRHASNDLKISVTPGVVPVVGPPSGDMPMPSLLCPQQQLRHYDTSLTISRHVQDLEGNLTKTLETVLAEAMARDVVHGKYRPKLEPVDILKVFSDFTCCATLDDDDEGPNLCRFKVQIETMDDDNDKVNDLIQEPNTSPPLLLLTDPQLLKCIHRNAISNANRYGASEGIISTNIRYLKQSNTLEVNVVNAPGPNHDELVKMGVSSWNSVFLPGKRLHPDDYDDDNNNDDGDSFVSESGYESDYESDDGDDDLEDSSGDGAWIMQECAKTLNGSCTIRFEHDQTILSFSCPAQPYELPSTSTEEEELESVPPPHRTWGIGIDDSGIQRRILSRILYHVGIENSKCIVFGKTPEESKDMIETIITILQHHPDDYVLLLVDENLDYDASHGRSLSGSKVVEELRTQLEPNQELRLLALIRSANDSTGDLDLYKSRTHGFFPKSTMKKDDVIKILTPIWRSRFSSTSTPTPLSATTKNI